MVALSLCTSHTRPNSSTASPAATNHCTSSHSLIPSPVCASLHAAGGREGSVTVCSSWQGRMLRERPSGSRGAGGAPPGASGGGGRWRRWQAGRSTLWTCLNCFRGPLSPDAVAVAKVLAAGENTPSSDPARQASVRQLAVCCTAISVAHAAAGKGRGAPRPQPAPPGASSALSSRRAPRLAARLMAVCMTCKAELGVPGRRPTPLWRS